MIWFPVPVVIEWEDFYETSKENVSCGDNGVCVANCLCRCFVVLGVRGDSIQFKSST
jgi:hypothetical protein